MVPPIRIVKKTDNRFGKLKIILYLCVAGKGNKPFPFFVFGKRTKPYSLHGAENRLNGIENAPFCNTKTGYLSR